MTQDSLPPLPELITHPAWDYAGATEVVGQNDAIALLRTYGAECARAAALAEREQCALICDNIEASSYAAYRPSGTLAARDCAEAIRRGR